MKVCACLDKHNDNLLGTSSVDCVIIGMRTFYCATRSEINHITICIPHQVCVGAVPQGGTDEVRVKLTVSDRWPTWSRTAIPFMLPARGGAGPKPLLSFITAIVQPVLAQLLVLLGYARPWRARVLVEPPLLSRCLLLAVSSIAQGLWFIFS